MANREDEMRNGIMNNLQRPGTAGLPLGAPPLGQSPLGQATPGPSSAGRAGVRLQRRDVVAHPVSTSEAVMQPPTAGRQARDLSTMELVKEITGEVGRLAQKQIELAKVELKADLKAEATTIGGLGVAALAALGTLNMLLVTLVLVLAQWMPAWAAGLIVSGFTLLVAGVVALISWNKRVKSPMARTRRAVKEDVQFTKERLV